jgi:hypothetical protein
MKANLAKKKLLEEKKTQDYVKLMLEFVVHGSILMFGLLLWGFGVGYESPSFSIVLKRMLIRGGELICQVHCVVSVLFFKQLRDFRFKTEQGKLPVAKEVPAARPVEKTLQIAPEKTLKMVQM